MYHKCDTYLFLKYSAICSQVIKWTFKLLQAFCTYMKVQLVQPQTSWFTVKPF